MSCLWASASVLRVSAYVTPVIPIKPYTTSRRQWKNGTSKTGRNLSQPVTQRMTSRIHAHVRGWLVCCEVYISKGRLQLPMINFWTSPCVSQERKERRERETSHTTKQHTVYLGGYSITSESKEECLDRTRSQEMSEELRKRDWTEQSKSKCKRRGCHKGVNSGYQIYKSE